MEETFKGTAAEGLFEEAYGWCYFENVGKGAFIIGLGGAKGDVYLNKNGEAKLVGKSTLMEASAGWSLGVKVASEIVFFEDEDAFEAFTSQNFQFGAGASAIVLNKGGVSATGVSKKYNKDGYAIFLKSKIGAMIDVSVDGQKFMYKSLE